MAGLLLVGVSLACGRPTGGGGPAPSGGQPPRDRLLGAAVVGSLAVAVGSFIAVQPLIDLAKHAVTGSLPF